MVNKVVYTAFYSYVEIEYVLNIVILCKYCCYSIQFETFCFHLAAAFQILRFDWRIEGL